MRIDEFDNSNLNQKKKFVDQFDDTKKITINDIQVLPFSMKFLKIPQ